MKKNRKIKLALGVCFFLVLMCGDGWTAMTDYPTRPINFIIGYTAGGGPDVWCRALCEVASKILGQPIVVLNRPGAATSLSMTQIKNEKPDGYTIGHLVGSSILTPHLEKVPYDVNKDFTPIIKIVENAMGLAVSTASPWKTMQDLITYSKTNPGKFKYAHFGTVNFMAMENFAREAGLKWVSIPQKGAKEAALALLGKHVDAYVGAGDIPTYVASGDWRVLVTFGKKRYRGYPDVPTFIDLGYKTFMLSPGAMVGPRGLPEPILEKLHNAFKQAMDDPVFLRLAKNLNLEISYSDPKSLGQEIKDLDDLFAKLVKEFNLGKN